MKNSISLLIVLILCFIATSNSVYAQAQFETGNIAIELNEYGRIRVFSPDLSTRQIDRSSILVGVSTTAVFDYIEDANTFFPPGLILTPFLSDYELVGSFDNSYSNLPPNVLVDEDIYGWNSEAGVVVKFTVHNNEASAINAVIGLEVIPQVDGSYGFETVGFNSTEQIVMINKLTYVGYKLFSASLTSLALIDWFSGYNNDLSFYTWLTQGTIDPTFTAGADGAVAILGTNPVSIDAGASVDLYLGISTGTNESEVISNMNTSYSHYLSIVPVELTGFTAAVYGNTVQLKWTTATELNNQGFEIQRAVADNGEAQQWQAIGFKEGAGSSTEETAYLYNDDISSLNAALLKYRLKQIDFNGAFTFSDEIEVIPLPGTFALEQNYPNPFNPETKIRFSVPQSCDVSIKLFNSIGEEVRTILENHFDPGKYAVDFKSDNLPSGVYFYRLNAGNFSITKKMTILK